MRKYIQREREKRKKDRRYFCIKMMSSTTDNIVEDETMTGKRLEIFIY